MHYCTLVLGPDPEGQLQPYAGPGQRVDWFAIGGRYTGNLILKQGATSGRVYGDAMPEFEVHLAMMPRPDDTAIGARGLHGTQHGPGVDQARHGDVDWPVTPVASPAILVDHGQWHEPDDEAFTTGMVASMCRATVEMGAPIFADRLRDSYGVDSLAELEALAEKQLAPWNEFVARRIAACGQDVLVTVFDVHQ